MIGLVERVAGGIAKRARDHAARGRVGGDLPSLGDTLRDGHEAAWSHVPVTFVASTGRVGSKTLTALWGLADHVQAEHEPLPRLVQVSGKAWQTPDDERWRDVVRAARDDLIADAYRRGRRYAETNNRLTSLAPAILASYRGANGVMLWREPEAFVLSALRRGYYAGHHWDFARYRPRPDDPAAAQWASWSNGLRAAWLWAATNSFVLDCVEVAEERWTVIASERLFAGDPDALDQAFAAVGAIGDRRPPPRSVDRVLSKRINAQRDGTADQALHGPGEAGQFAELIQPVLDRLRAV